MLHDGWKPVTNGKLPGLDGWAHPCGGVLLGVNLNDVIIRRAESPGRAVAAKDGSLGKEIAPFVSAGVLGVIKAVFGNVLVGHQVKDASRGIIRPGLGGVIGSYRTVRPFHVKACGRSSAGKDL